MSYRLVLRPGAARELHKAVDWYNEKHVGLGERFLRAVDLTLAGVEQMPERFPAQGRFHRALVPGFPYAIFFAVLGQDVLIVRLRHTRRKPLG